MTSPTDNHLVPSGGNPTADAGNRAGWTTYLVVSVLLCMHFFQTGVFGPYKEKMAVSLGVSLDRIVFTETLGYVVAAVFLIPGALILERVGVRRLAWPCAVLAGLSSFLIGLSQTVVGMYAGVVMSTLSFCVLMPMTGLIARTRLDQRVFIMVLTLTLVTVRLFEVTSLTLAGLLSDLVPWRVFYLGIGVALVPLIICAWRMVTEGPVAVQEENVRSVSALLSLLRTRVVLFCGIALALALAPTTAFGFIWDINLQAAFGWEEPMKSVLTATFVLGVISGGLLAGVVANWVGAYGTTLFGLALGSSLFAVLLFDSGESQSAWHSMPLMFFCGVGLGATALIAPYAAKCVAPRTAGLVFSITGTIKSLFSGVIVGVPLWFLPTERNWTLEQDQHSLVPYLVALVIAVAVFFFAHAKSYEERSVVDSGAS